jgi:drug/metabolite transporter (DMT)-like permease
MTTPLTSSENIKGMLWMLLGGAIFSTVFSLIRYLGDSLHVFELVFLRNLFGFIALVPFLLRADYSNLTPKRPGLMVGRGVVHLVLRFIADTPGHGDGVGPDRAHCDVPDGGLAVKGAQ